MSKRHDTVTKQIDRLDKERKDNQFLYKNAKVIINLRYLAANLLLSPQSDEEKVRAINKAVQYKTDIANLEASCSMKHLLSCLYKLFLVSQKEKRQLREDMTPILTLIPNEVHPDIV